MSNSATAQTVSFNCSALRPIHVALAPSRHFGTEPISLYLDPVPQFMQCAHSVLTEHTFRGKIRKFSKGLEDLVPHSGPTMEQCTTTMAEKTPYSNQDLLSCPRTPLQYTLSKANGLC